MTNVLLEKKGHIAVATINRPKALNALNSQVLEDIDQLVEQVKADDEIRALVITGSGEKAFVALDTLEDQVQAMLTAVHDNLYAQAEKNLEDNTFDLTTWEEVRDMAQGRGGFARTKWCGSLECELAMKEKAGVSSRCMPLKQSGTVGKCPVCGKECATDIYWGVAY